MKYDVSNIINQADERGIHIKDIVGTGLVSQATLYRAWNGAMVSAKTRNSITRAIAMCSQEADDVAFNQGHEVSTEQLAANLEKQVEQLRDTVAFNFANVQIPVNKVDGLHPSCTTLVDDAIESAHSREKAELQKALATRISEVQNLAADVAYERLKNETQYQSIGQCFAEIKRLQDELNHQKLITASRNADLAVYQKALEDADARLENRRNSV